MVNQNDHKSNSMSIDQKIEMLTKDFLERDGETFVRIRTNGRLGWESTIPQDGAYSEYMLHPKTQEDLITNAYRMAGEMITVMDAPFKVNISITSDNSCTDSKTVWVATKVFDDADLPVGKKLDTFIGLAVHEGCHLLYTDFNENAEAENEIVHNLQNIIEDERIERECGESKPGLANFLKASKYYYFDKYRKELQKDGKMDGLDVFQRLMNCILSFVRYPKALELEDLKLFCDVMLKVREILIPYPSSTAGSMEAARKIYEVIKDFMVQQEQQSASSQGTGTPGESEQQKQQGMAQKKMNDGMDSMRSALQNLSSEPEKTGLSDEEKSETVKQDGEKVGKVCEGRLEKGIQRGTYVEKGTEMKEQYLESLSRVKKFIPAISKALKCSSLQYKMILKGMRSGMLDTNKLAEAYQGVPTVYVREGEVKTDRIAVCILIDESGSMWGTGEMAARDTAILLNEALGEIPNVDLYIYGHTASRSTTNLFVYRERTFRGHYALGSTDSRAGNHDSIAIREAASRVRRNTKEKCLFFMISDGAPNESTDMVRKAVSDVEKDGFSIVAISIDPYYDPSTMYSHNINLTDMNTLAVDLGKHVKKAILKNTNKTISR